MLNIKNPFGGADEQAMIDQFYALHGRNVAENLDRIRKNCVGRDWRKAAIRAGYLAGQISDFEQL